MWPPTIIPPPVSDSEPPAASNQLSDKPFYADAELLHIFVEISIGRGRHGGFLTSFAEAVSQADPENFPILRPVMEALVCKYGLAKYLDTCRLRADQARAEGA